MRGEIIAMNGDSDVRLKDDLRVGPDTELAALTHPDYDTRFPQWSRVRDCCEGQDHIKARKTLYLPKRAKQKDESYEADLKRAVFFNATGRTRQALLSSVFRRPGVVRLPSGINGESVTRDGMSVRKVARWGAEELLTTSRAGMLLDLPEVETTVPSPFLTLYPAERVLSWAEERGVLKMVLLAERVTDNSVTKNMFKVSGKWQIRLLALDEAGEYYQLTGTPQMFSNMTSPPAEGRVYPVLYERRLKYIPFQFFGASRNDVHPEKPVLLDIADVNLAHYVSSSNLERSRAFVGSPIYATFTDTNSDADEGEAMVVSPEMLWEFGSQDDAKILEFTGQGLSSLENGMEEKEELMRVLGARLVSQRKNAAARSSEAEQNSNQHDDATLLDVVNSLDAGLTQIFRWWAEWTRKSKNEVEIVLNKYFKAPNVGARELRAIDACLDRTLRPEDIFRLLQEAGLIGEDEDKEEYLAWIEKLRQEKEEAAQKKLQAQKQAAPDKD